MKRLGIAIFLALSWAVAARADDLSCRNGGFPAEEKIISLAKVEGADRLYFLTDTDGCPGEDVRCRQRAYVVAADVLLTGRGHGPYVCAFYPSRGGGSAGWVRRDRLAPMPIKLSPPLLDWIGQWANGDDTITLTAKDGALVADGDAYWPSANPPLSDRPGGPNFGELTGIARPKSNRVVFADSDPQACAATLTLVGSLLIVSDNGACGGMNVSFSGVYRRKAPAPARRPAKPAPD
jgi:hypothetical protein